MIFVTGDTHGTIDLRKLGSKWFSAKRLTKRDYVIVCGDFGLVWKGDATERWWLDWLEKKPFTTLFVDGNHEGFARLNSLPVETWHGGRVHRVRDSVLHLMRGEIFDIDGLRFFAMGGAYSMEADKRCRIEDISWFPEEVPSDAERAHALETLEATGWRVDYVLTHCAPSCAVSEVFEADTRHPADEYCDWLEHAVMDRLSYRRWFCGHYHVNKALSHNIEALYNDFVKIEGDGDTGEDRADGASSDDDVVPHEQRIVSDDPATWRAAEPTPGFLDALEHGRAFVLDLADIDYPRVETWPDRAMLWEIEGAFGNDAPTNLRALAELYGYADFVALNAARCRICGDYIESTSRHDLVWCACGNVAVDGGHDYARRCMRTNRYDNVVEFGFARADEVGREIAVLDRLGASSRMSFTSAGTSSLYEVTCLDEDEGHPFTLYSYGSSRAEAARALRADNPDLVIEEIARVEES